MNYKTALQQVKSKLKKAAPYITLACFILFVLYVAFDIYKVCGILKYMPSQYVNYDTFKSEKKNIDLLTKRFFEIYESVEDENGDIDCVFIDQEGGDNWEVVVEERDIVKIVPKSDEEKEAAGSVTSFKWARIVRVYDDRVVFYGAGKFAIVYMKSGFSPKSLFGNDDLKESRYTDRIAGKYYVYVPLND